MSDRSAIEPSAGKGWRAVGLWLVGVAAAGSIAWLIYSLAALGVPGCEGDIIGWYAGGGQLESLQSAAVLGAALWLVAGIAAWRLRRWLARFFGGFVGVYTIGLTVLWIGSPLFWGPRYCPGSAVTHVPGQIGGLLNGHSDSVGGVSFSRDERLLISSGWDGTLRLWDVQARREVGGPLWRYGDRIYDAALSPSGRVAAATACDGTVRLWNVHTRTRLGKPLLADDDGACVNAVAFSPDGRLLASGSEDGYGRLWDVRTHRKLADLPNGSPEVDGFEDITFSGDGRFIAAAANVGGAGAVVVWDAHSHRQLLRVRGIRTPVESAALSLDGRLLAFGAYSGTIRVWNLHDDRQVGRPYQGGDIADSVAFSPDGRLLAACFDNGILKVWNVKRQQELGRPLQVGAFSLAFSPSGRILAIGNSDGTIRLMRAPR